VGTRYCPVEVMVSNPPLVTVCVPTFKRPELLEVALKSALHQTLQNFVIIVGDNGSVPETEAVIQRLNDPRITHVKHTDNLGMMGNWVWLMNQAKTPFAASLHDDDQWQPTFLEETVAAMQQHPDVAMVFTRHSLVDENGTYLPTLTTERHNALFTGLQPGVQPSGQSETLHRAFVRNAPQPAYSALLRTSAVQSVSFPEEAGPVYDLWLTYQLGIAGQQFFYIPKDLTLYRVWPGSATKSGIMAASEDWLFHLALTEQHDADPVVLNQIKQRWAELRFSRAMTLIDNSVGRRTARQLLRESAPALSGARRAVATAAGRSVGVLHALNLVRKGRAWVGNH
jgi:glycosyltransferase involved in cell wall biosynthesis